MNLFSKEKITFSLPDADIEYYPEFIFPEIAFELFNKLLIETPWQQDNITVFGKTYSQPRLTALFGNEGKTYSYSNIVMTPHPWNPLLLNIKNKVEEICGVKFTTVLLNLYRNGQDSNGWHADNEIELGQNPVIASVSLGAERLFKIKHNMLNDKNLKIELNNGSLLLMKGATQQYWKHQIPKTTKTVGPRINLTFRKIV
jgi:alkylated DNA repair dioxygenase AlkB